MFISVYIACIAVRNEIQILNFNIILSQTSVAVAHFNLIQVLFDLQHFYFGY